jgi:hypothetical protein
MSTPLVSPTVASLIRNARNLLNQPDPNNSFWSDSELLSYLNEAVRIYFAELSDIDEGEFLTSTTLDITSGVENIDLPSDFFKVKRLFKTVTGGYVLLPYRNNLVEGYITDGGTSPEAYVPYYQFQNNQLVLRPTPNFSQVAGLKLEYIAMPYTLVDSSDQVDAQISPIFRQCVEMYMVYKAKLKESLVTGVRTHDIAQENLAILAKQFKDISALRAKAITSVVPFNPEGDL